MVIAILPSSLAEVSDNKKLSMCIKGDLIVDCAVPSPNAGADLTSAVSNIVAKRSDVTNIVGIFKNFNEALIYAPL